MCFAPKVKMPKATVQSTPIEPAPLKDEIAGVVMGDGSKASENTGIDSVKVDKQDSSDDKTEELTNNSTSSSDIAATVGKSIKRKSIFGGK